MEGGEKFGSHAFAIHNDPSNSGCPSLLLIACHDGRQSAGQMGIPTVRGSKQGVTVLVMQQDKCSTSQNGRQPPYQSPWEQHRAVHRLAMSIDVEGEGLV